MDNPALDTVGLKLDECLANYKAAYNERIRQLEEKLRQQEVELRQKDTLVRQKDDDISELHRELQARMQEIKTLRNESAGTQDSASSSSLSDNRTTRVPVKRHADNTHFTASKKQRVAESTKRHPFVPGEVWIDVFAPLSRYQLDAIGFASRRFRRIVADSMSSVCLRPIDSVTLTRPVHDQAYGAPVPPAPFECSRTDGYPQRLVCAVCLTYTKLLPMAAARPSGSAQPAGDRATGKIPFKQEEAFYSMPAAFEYACSLLQSANVASIIVEGVPLTQDFFNALDRVAPTLSVGRLNLRPQRNSQLPESYLRTLLKLVAVQHIRVLDENSRVNQLADDVFIGMAAKSVLQLRILYGFDNAPLNAHSNVSDDGILAFLFRDRHENVTLDVDILSISKNFSQRLLQSAQQSASNARVHLRIGRRVDVSSQERELAETFGQYRREHRRRITYKLPITAGMQIRLRFNLNLNGGALLFRCIPIGGRQTRHDSDSSSSDSSFGSSSSSDSDGENNNIVGNGRASSSESSW